ncbi:MAG: single-stranded DNA-binding protein [Planctomycetota bacterium]
MATIARLRAITRELVGSVSDLEFGPPVAAVYNPLVYARRPHDAYLSRWAVGRKRFVLLGMNPGPWGMAQTGVPFGEIAAVRDWLGIEARVDRPENEYAPRPIQGFDCPRSEVSGRRLWGYWQRRFGTPEHFFADHVVLNYCPLVFMEEGGRNRTPDKLPREERRPLEAACDAALRSFVEAWRPEMILGVGGFAEKCARRVFGDEVAIASIPHPSPASPAANRGWDELVDARRRELGLA